MNSCSSEPSTAASLKCGRAIAIREHALVSTPAANQSQGPSPPPPRGSSPTPRRWRFALNRNWTIFFLVLLALNIYLGSRAMKEPARPRVPYSPFFLQQVREGHVKEITSKGTAIQGTFTEK